MTDDNEYLAKLRMRRAIGTYAAPHDIDWLLAYADRLIAALAASEARVAALHTDHEYDVEKVLWRLLVANQQYILALIEGDAVLAGVWLNRLKVFQQLWLKNGEWYMQHPKWDTAGDDIVGDIAG